MRIGLLHSQVTCLGYIFCCNYYLLSNQFFTILQSNKENPRMSMMWKIPEMQALCETLEGGSVKAAKI
mgnify:CR=1 FL=1